MRLIAVAATGWRVARMNALALIQELLASKSPALVTTLDTETLRRASASKLGAIDVRIVSLESWLKPDADAYLVDVPAVHALATNLSAARPVILDCTGYPPGVIRESLQVARQAWFGLESWHPSFVLVCDDTHLRPLSDDLLDAFYVRPAALTSQEATRMARHIQKRATIARWFGARASRMQGRAYRVWDAFERALTRDRQQALADKWKHG